MKVIGGRAFAERFALSPFNYAWLLGAGASATAGIPTGYQMIQDFRARLFASETGISLREVDASDPVWQARIDEHHTRRGQLPPRGDPLEYSRAFEALHPTVEDRRLYIRNRMTQGSPSLGHKVLGSLLSSRGTPCVFTTNFDTLVEDAATVAAQMLPVAERARVTVAALDNTSRASTSLRNNDGPLVVKLHGDYQSLELKNTDEELQSQDAGFRAVLTQSLQRYGLIVVGYSGRDQSVMQALTDVLQAPTPFPAGIYWLSSDPQYLLPAVRDFLEQAELAQVDTHVISGTTFDELAGDIADVTALPKPLVDHVFGDRAAHAPQPVVLVRDPALRTPVLRLTAVPIEEMPTSARRLKVQTTANIQDVRALLKDAKVHAAVSQAGSPENLVAFGPDEGLVQALTPLQASAAGEIALDPIKDSWAKGLLYDALVRALCQWKPLRARLHRRGHTIQVSRQHPDLPREKVRERQALLAKLKRAYRAELVGNVPGTSGTYAEGFEVRLEQADGRWWFAFDPMTFIDIPIAVNEDDLARVESDWRAAEEWRRERWAQMYNWRWAGILDAWVELFTVAKGRSHCAYDVASGAGIDARFLLGTHSARSRPAHDHEYFHLQRGPR